MNALVSLGNSLLDVARRLLWLPPLLARVTVGWMFFQAGMGKLGSIENVIGFFTSLGIPAPVFNAYLVAWIECLGGLLLIVGLGARLISIPLSVIMIVALCTAQSDKVTGFTALAGITDFLYLILLVWLMIAGPGRVAVDTLVARRYRHGA